MNPISLASGVVPGATPAETVYAAKAGGFDMVGLWIEPPNFTDQVMRDAKAALAETQLPVLDVEVIWLQPGPFNEDHLRLLDIGQELGAANALVVSAEAQDEHTAEKLRQVCQHVESSDMRIALEFGVFTAVKSLPQALNILKMVDHAASALLVDPIHIDRSGTTVDQIASIPQHLLPYAQFCDAPKPGPDITNLEAVIEDAVDSRRQLGEGDLPIAAMLGALPSNIPLSIELRSKALRDGWPDYAERAKVTADITRAWLNDWAGRA